MGACLIAQQVCTDTIVNTIIGAFIGAVLGALVSWWFALQSSSELREEAAHLRKMNEALLHGMEQAGWIKVTRNESGEYVGFVFELRGNAGMRVGVTGNLGAQGDIGFVTPGDPQQPPTSDKQG